ncbi:Vegetative incompatibility protein HET-E-1 [Colletotrichum fructicola]|nr:Vegetative incompatibility protein HET-E-1 [Colletotrichum fructicola]KAF4936096.1 Vegetative incompatibility protein HET-E-1 [Colletotrichum fructicola]
MKFSISTLLMGLAAISSVAASPMPIAEVSVANQEAVETRDLVLTTDLEAPSTGLSKRAMNSKFKIHIVNAAARVLGIIIINYTINPLPGSHESITANFVKFTNVRANGPVVATHFDGGANPLGAAQNAVFDFATGIVSGVIDLASPSMRLTSLLHVVSKEKDTFLADLRVTDPRDDKTRIERTKGHLLRDSYRWILEHDDFCQWRAERRLLWIKGGPGKGKTMLLCGVIDELLAMGYKSTFFFFCQATDARLSSATSVLRSLLYLMIDQSPVLLDSLRNKYDQAGAGIFDDVNTWDVLCKMILSAVSHPSLQDVILVIDALDECNSGLDQLISFIIDLTAHVKIIASSRPDSRIERALAPASNDTKIYLSLEMNEGAISAAVEHYIYHKVDELAILKEFDDEMKINVRNYLCTKADNTFLWVALD